MNARRTLALVSVALVVAGCGSGVTAPTPVSVEPLDVRPAGLVEMTQSPAADDTDCDREASLRPGPLPPPGQMPAGSTMAEIYDRGRLIVGVDQSQYLFGFRDPDSGQIEGFDIDIARSVAQAIFGSPDKIELRVVDAGQRETVLQDGDVDLVVRTFSINCARMEKVAFSSVYFYAEQKILVPKDSGITSVADLEGKQACAVTDTTSQAKLYSLVPRPTVWGAPTWTDCLVMMQQGQIDVIGTDAVVLAGLEAQDPTVEVVGPSLSREPYGVGVNKENTDLVRFVNGVLEQVREDGRWQRFYDDRLVERMGPSDGPPTPQYRD